MAKRTKHALQDWRSIADDREKYQAYLCSREWAEKKVAVHKRAGGKCERCRVLPIDAVHHLTYARKYNEQLEDLQAICQPCHDFTHGKEDFDPTWDRGLLRFLVCCRECGAVPIPLDVLCGLADPEELSFPIGETLRACLILSAANLSTASERLAITVPFAVPGWWLRGERNDPSTASVCYRITGWKDYEDPAWWMGDEDGC